MPFTDSLDHESPSKKKRQERQRKIDAANQQAAKLESDRKARQQSKFTSRKAQDAPPSSKDSSARSKSSETVTDALNKHLDPDIGERGSILPLGRNKKTGELVFAVPEVGLSLARSVMLPGHIAKGGKASMKDVTEMAGNVAGSGVAARVGAKARKAVPTPREELGVGTIKEIQISGRNPLPKGMNLLKRQSKDIGELSERTASGVNNPELPTKITYDRLTGNDAKKLRPEVQKFLPRKDNKFSQAVRQIDKNGITHALKKHGNDPIPLKKEDLSHIPDVVKNGEVVGVQRNRENTGIVYRKKFNGNWLYVVENVVGRSNITLKFQTAYWNKATKKQ